MVRPGWGAGLTNWWVFCGRYAGREGAGCLVWVWVMGVTLGPHTRGQHWSSGQRQEWNVVVNMINAALFYSNVPAWEQSSVHTRHAYHILRWSNFYQLRCDGTQLWLTGAAQINDGQTAINHITQNWEQNLVRDGTEWILPHWIQESKYLPKSSETYFYLLPGRRKTGLKWTHVQHVNLRAINNINHQAPHFIPSLPITHRF